MSATAQFAIRSAGHAQWRERGLVSELIADQAVLALLHELAIWPKPGLVSHVDRGSHTDMDAAMLQASAETLRRFFAELARTGQEGADMGRLRTIGLRAEAAMLAVTGGINTHRGAIFGLGLLSAAAGEVSEISSGRYGGCAGAPRRRRDAAMGCGDPARPDPAVESRRCSAQVLWRGRRSGRGGWRISQRLRGGLAGPPARPCLAAQRR